MKAMAPNMSSSHLSPGIQGLTVSMAWDCLSACLLHTFPTPCFWQLSRALNQVLSWRVQCLHPMMLLLSLPLLLPYSFLLSFPFSILQFPVPIFLLQPHIVPLFSPTASCTTSCPQFHPRDWWGQWLRKGLTLTIHPLHHSSWFWSGLCPILAQAYLQMSPMEEYSHFISAISLPFCSPTSFSYRKYAQLTIFYSLLQLIASSAFSEVLWYNTYHSSFGYVYDNSILCCLIFPAL